MTALLKQQIEEYLISLRYDEKMPHRLYAPMDYILKLKGKRIRPMLVLLAYQAVAKSEAKPALGLACATELFHNFTLIHDDIMDNAPTRRGNDTVHIKWDTNVAILSGDTMFAVAVEMAAKNFPEKAGTIIPAFLKVAIEVCEGQMEDMDFALEGIVTIPSYIEMIRKKTSVLLGGCLKLGALAAGASEELAQRFYQMGEAAGIGFQLQDDLMDAFPPKDFGKQIGGDIIENKKTFLLLKAFELANTTQLQQLDYLLNTENSHAQKVSGVCDLYQALDIPQITQNLINQYFQQAYTLLDELAKESDTTLIKNYLGEIAMRKV
ncbi:MAG: polyprenyl synthetase family protein [Bacteroidia bacterium]